MNKTFLITRPFYDPTTCYLYYWSKALIESAKRKSISVIDLSNKRANRKEFESIIRKTNPKLIMFNGHGSQDYILGHNGEIIIKANENDILLRYKIIYALSCATARVLGPSCITKGAEAYLGYNEVFIFTHDKDKIFKPLEDKQAELFLSSSNQILLSLIKGHSVKEAFVRTKVAYLNNIQKVLASGSSNAYIARWLVWDMMHLTSLGNQSATI